MPTICPLETYNTPHLDVIKKSLSLGVRESQEKLSERKRSKATEMG